MKIGKTSVQVCNKTYNYKPCTPNDILQYQKDIENKWDKFKPMEQDSNRYQDDKRKIESRLHAIDTNIQAIQQLEKPSDDILLRIIEYNEEKTKLEEERTQLLQKEEELNKKYKKEMENFREELYLTYAKMAETQLEEMTAEYFLANATQLDITIIKLLPTLKEMAETGSSQKELEKHVRKNVEAEAKQSLRNRTDSFQ